MALIGGYKIAGTGDVGAFEKDVVVG